MLTFQKIDRQTAQLERNAIKRLRKEYANTLIKIREEMALMNAKASMLEAFNYAKYNRLETLEKNINAELGKLSKATDKTVKSYLKQVYKVNYDGATEYLGGLTNVHFAKIEAGAVAKAITNPLERLALDELEEKVKMNIRRNLTQGIVQGKGINGISRDIKVSLEQNLNNATRIARTETTRVVNDSRLEAFKKSEEKGLELVKVWISSHDDRTRESHQMLDGEEVPIDETFSNGLMFPGDQSTGQPEETINCRCTMVARVIN